MHLKSGVMKQIWAQTAVFFSVNDIVSNSKIHNTIKLPHFILCLQTVHNDSQKLVKLKLKETLSSWKTKVH